MKEARSRSTDKRYYGVAEGIVTDVNDPDQEGRVRVRFPWFDDQTVSDWCRVRQLYAGSGYGTFFVPEVGDEVLVAFIHGDMRLPVVLGGLYNGQDKPSVHRSDSSDPKLVRTRRGHQILLDDTNGGEKIQIVDSGGSNFILIDTVANTITIKAESDVTVESANGRLSLKGVGVEINSRAEVKIQATATMDLKATTINLN